MCCIRVSTSLVSVCLTTMFLILDHDPVRVVHTYAGRSLQLQVPREVDEI